MPGKKPKAKYSKELEEIKKMRDLNAIMKRADIENALLSAPSSEIESVSDNRIDSMLDNLAMEKNKESSLDAIERLTTSGNTARVFKVATKTSHSKRPSKKSSKRGVAKTKPPKSKKMASKR